MAESPFTLRIPPDLRRLMEHEAKLFNQSLASFIIGACWARLEGKRDGYMPPHPSKLMQQLEASIGAPVITTLGPDTSQEVAAFASRTPSIQSLRDICTGKIYPWSLGGAPVESDLQAMCDYTEYDQDSGETMACGLPQHSMKQKHGNWRKA